MFAMVFDNRRRLPDLRRRRRDRTATAQTRRPSWYVRRQYKDVFDKTFKLLSVVVETIIDIKRLDRRTHDASSLLRMMSNDLRRLIKMFNEFVCGKIVLD